MPGKTLVSHRPLSRMSLADIKRELMRRQRHVGTLERRKQRLLRRIETIDAFWHMKRRGLPPVEPVYEPIEMPRNSPTGFIIAFFAVVTGFALIWYIWWMVVLGLLAAAVTLLVSGWSDPREHEISATEVALLERARLGLGRPA